MTLTIAHGILKIKIFIGLRFALRAIGRSKKDDEEFRQALAACSDELIREIKAYKKRCGKFVLFEAFEANGKTRVTFTV